MLNIAERKKRNMNKKKAIINIFRNESFKTECIDFIFSFFSFRFKNDFTRNKYTCKEQRGLIILQACRVKCLLTRDGNMRPQAAIKETSAPRKVSMNKQGYIKRNYSFIMPA